MKQNNTERQQKIAALKSLLSGNLQPKDLNKPAVLFIELSEKESQPGIYYNKQGQSFTEAEKDQLIQDAQKKTDLVFSEIRSI